MAHVPPPDKAATRDIVFTEKCEQYLPGSLIQVNDEWYKFYVTDKKAAVDYVPPAIETPAPKTK